MNAGPVVHTPGAELMSRRHVVVLFAIGTLGCLDCRPLFSTELCSCRGLNRPTCLEPAHYIQELTYLLVTCQQEVVGRCRPGRPRIGRYVVYTYSAAEGGAPARYEHLAIERTRG